MIKNEIAVQSARGSDLAIPLKERKTLRTLKRNECRWPYGDPRKREFYFCGKRKATGHPYCEFHMDRAIQPSRPRAYRPHRPRAAS
jgi:GcrA cell cycle regulator